MLQIWIRHWRLSVEQSLEWRSRVQNYFSQASPCLCHMQPGEGIKLRKYLLVLVLVNITPNEQMCQNVSTWSPASHPAWPTTAEVFTKGPPRFRSCHEGLYVSHLSTLIPMQTVSMVRVAGFVFISALRSPFLAPVSGAKVDSRLIFKPFSTWSWKTGSTNFAIFITLQRISRRHTSTSSVVLRMLSVFHLEVTVIPPPWEHSTLFTSRFPVT